MNRRYTSNARLQDVRRYIMVHNNIWRGIIYNVKHCVYMVVYGIGTTYDILRVGHIFIYDMYNMYIIRFHARQMRCPRLMCSHYTI